MKPRFIKLIYVTLTFILIRNNSALANTQSDSLFSVFNSTVKSDTSRLRAIDDLIWEHYRFTNTDSAYILAQKQYEFAAENNYPRWMARAKNALGTIQYIQGNYQGALNHFSDALEIKSNLHDLMGYGDMLGNIAGVYLALGKYDQSIAHSFKVLTIQEELNGTLGIGTSYNNIGVIYYNQGELDKALEYYKKGLETREQVGDREGIGSSYLNIASVHKDQGRFEQAKDYYFSGLEIKRELGDRYSEAKILLELGDIKHINGKEEEALELFNQSLEIREMIKDQRGTSNSLYYLAHYYYDLGDYNQAIALGERSRKISVELGLAKETFQASKVLSDSYKKQGKYEKALELFESYKVHYDSVMNLNNITALSQQEYNYISRKNAIIDSIQDSNIKKINDAKFASQQAELSEERTKKYTLLSGSIVLLILSIIMFRLYKRSLEQKRIIQIQKTEVEEQRERLSQELASKNKELTNFALHLSQRNDFLREMKRDLSGAFRTTDLTAIQSRLKEISLKFQQYSNDNKEEREFITKLESLNETFYENLSDKIPNISEKEKRLCSMIRLGLTSKEIASIVNISPKSVDVSRYRLRLKPGLPRGGDLKEFLTQI